MQKKPFVSILINNYNYGHFLNRAINSTLNQTYRNLEVIVVDDGSTDNSKSVINSYKGKVIPIFKDNGGQASAFNAGFKQSKGEVICFLDADDLFVCNKIERVANLFNNYLEIGWCFHPLNFVDKNCKSLNVEQEYTGKSGIYDIRSSLKKGKLRGKLPFGRVATSGLCYRRSLLEKLLPMPESIRITSDDYLKYAAFALSTGYALVEELSLQTIHDNNAYTLRTDKQELRAKINIATAYLLREKLPIITKFTNNIFALGLGICQQSNNSDLNTLSLIEKYIDGLTTKDKIEVSLRSFYYRYLK